MKNYRSLLLVLIISINGINAQERNFRTIIKNAEVGLSFGEIPIMASSFKPGISIGYHLNDYVYIGGIYQIVDHLERNDESYDAKSIGYQYLISSKEEVAPRAMLHTRIRPHKRAPFISIGILYNGNDIETIEFGDGIHKLGANNYSGLMTVQIKRGKAVRPGLGIGYHYDFKNGISLSTEWIFDWFNEVPTPEVGIYSENSIAEADYEFEVQRIEEFFKDNFHNRYHLFHLGISYKF